MLEAGKVSIEAAAGRLADLLPGLQHGYGDPPLPLEPTDAIAGSEEKIEIMRARIAAGHSPWHPDDSPLRLLRLGAVEPVEREPGVRRESRFPLGCRG